MYALYTGLLCVLNQLIQLLVLLMLLLMSLMVMLMMLQQLKNAVDPAVIRLLMILTPLLLLRQYWCCYSYRAMASDSPIIGNQIR